MEIIRTDATHQDFIHLVTQLDRMPAIINGEDHTFYRQFNTLSAIKNVVVLYDEIEAIA